MGANDDAELERLKLQYDFRKFLLGTVLLGGVTAAASWVIKERESERLEIEQYGKYVEHALADNVAKREQFARYFWRISRTPEAQQRWAAYLDDILKEKDLELGREAKLAAKEEELKKLAARDKAKAEELKAVRQELREVRSKLEVRRDAVAPGAILSSHGSGQASASGSLSVSGDASK